MDATDRAHIENLIKIDRAHLRELEVQQAKLGILAPSGIAMQIEEYRQKIADPERWLNEALPRHNLPPRDYERFVGRQKELQDVRRLLLPYPKSRHHLVTIDGIGGIGKSALALETAYLARERYTALSEPERFEADEEPCRVERSFTRSQICCESHRAASHSQSMTLKSSR